MLITRYNERLNISKRILGDLEEIAKRNNTKVFNTKIVEATAIKEAQNQQKTIFEIKPTSKAAINYAELVKEIFEEE